MPRPLRTVVLLASLVIAAPLLAPAVALTHAVTAQLASAGLLAQLLVGIVVLGSTQRLPLLRRREHVAARVPDDCVAGPQRVRQLPVEVVHPKADHDGWPAHSG